MRVINFLETSYWAIRTADLNQMVHLAYQHERDLEKVLAASLDRPATTLAHTGERLQGTRYVQMRGNVAVIEVNGIIAKRMDMFTEICVGGTSTEKLLRDFETAINSSRVESIVLHIDSPGGEAFGINEVAERIYSGRGKKPIKAYISGLGCSGAYWIASAADEVIIDKSAMLGSIGVVSSWSDDREKYRKMGIRREVVVSSNAPFKNLEFDKPEHRKELQKSLDAIEKVFLEAVARNRGVTVQQVISDFNKGGVRIGKDAVASGMADRTGSLESVISASKSPAPFARSQPKALAVPLVAPNLTPYRTAAAVFALTEIESGRSHPSERETLMKLHQQAAWDDERDPRIERTRLDLLREAFQARPFQINDVELAQITKTVDAQVETYLLGIGR